MAVDGLLAVGLIVADEGCGFLDHFGNESAISTGHSALSCMGRLVGEKRVGRAQSRFSSDKAIYRHLSVANVIWTPKTVNSILYPHIMLSVVGIAAKLIVYAGVAFLLGKTLANMGNKIYRFVLLFLVCFPLSFVINYINVSWLGYHKMGWTGASIIALVGATFGTFLPPQAQKSNTPRQDDCR